MAGDTIAAIATPPGEGGIGIVRLSGPDAFAIAARIFDGGALATHRVHHGHITTLEGEVLDEVVVLPYRAPKSYTGEDVIEICCHGGGAVTRAVLRLCYHQGARPADPGEFTKRAFLNERMDLAQAEAVCDLVRATSESQRRLAMRQLEGKLSQRVRQIRDIVLALLTVVEAHVDFSEEIGEIDKESLRGGLVGSVEVIRILREDFRQGRLIREGAVAAIVGLPNVGKSSLLNALVGADRAIVTEIPGTTRDTIEDRIVLDGVPVTLLDTAGLSESEDVVEQIGVRRTGDAIRAADVVLLVLSPSDWDHPENRSVYEERAAGRCLVVHNKCDLGGEVPRLGDPVSVSALTGEGLDGLRAALRDQILGSGPMESALVSRERHDAALADAEQAVNDAIASIDSGAPIDLVAVDLNAALAALGLITGQTVTADVVDRIFSDFCIGK
jgi:tRNA modification GTPase